MGAHWQSRNSGEWFEAVRDFAFAGVGDDATAVAPAAPQGDSRETEAFPVCHCRPYHEATRLRG